MRKLVFLILSVLILAGQSTAQTWYSWRYRYHATDCTSITDGKETDLCYEVDSQVLYKCVPSIGACDTVGEWKRIEAVEADPIVKAITGIVKSNGTTISAAVAGTDYQTPLTADTHYLTPTTAASTYQPLGSYLTSESDPKISTLTSGKWCTTNGSVITCNVDPVTDTNTTYSASGTLLQLIGTAFSVDEGTLTNGKGCKFVSGTGLVCDQDYLTSVASDSTWTGHNSYPAACSAGQYVSAIGDTLTCSAPTDNNTTYTASGSLLQLSSTAFSLKEGTLTNGKFCTYSTTSGLVCNSDANNYSLPTATDSVLGGIKVGSGLSITEGVLSATGGGYTNLTSFEDQTAWRLFYSDGSGDVKELALGSDGEYLKSNGASVAPSWGTPTGGAHDAVTLAGEDYLSLATQQITALPINGDNINWDTIQDLIGDTQINWASVQGITGSNINWSLIDEDVITGINWTAYEDTNTTYTAGRSLTLDGTTINADAELYTDNIFTFNLENPVTGDDGDFGHPGVAVAFTVTKVICNTDTGTVTINIEERVSTTPNTAGTDILSTDLVCDSNRQSSCASGCDVNTITNAGIDAEDVLALMISAVADSPTKLRVTLIGTKDD